MLTVFGRRGAARAEATGSASADRDPVVSQGLLERLEERRGARRSLRRRRLVTTLAAACAAALVVWALCWSPLLALRSERITVVGSDGTVSEDQVRQALAGQVGTSLALLDLGQVRQDVTGSLVRVRSASAVRQWPHGLRVRLTMREPVAVRSTGAGVEVLDADAVVLDTVAQAPEGLAVVTAPEDDAELTATQVAAVTQVVGDLDATTRALVASGTASRAGQVTLTLTSGATVIWGDTSQDELKAAVLTVLLANQAQTYDVSSPRSPTTS